jgi:hypothetical protein
MHVQINFSEARCPVTSRMSRGAAVNRRCDKYRPIRAG